MNKILWLIILLVAALIGYQYMSISQQKKEAPITSVVQTPQAPPTISEPEKIEEITLEQSVQKQTTEVLNVPQQEEGVKPVEAASENSERPPEELILLQ